LSFAKAGGAGAKFKNLQEKMLKALNLPKGAKEELNYPHELIEKIQNGAPLFEEEEKNLETEPNEDGEFEDEGKEKKETLTDEQKMMMTMFGEGKYHLIPSFFRTLITLKKQKREFAICFRTYGQDLQKIEWEFNQFCQGLHPCFSGRNGTPLIKFDGTKGTKDLKIRDDCQKGLYFRFSNEIQDSKFLQGISTRHSNDFDELNEMINNELADKYEDVNVISDPIQQYQCMLETFKKFSSMAIQDDY
jgi:hypothetical protein